MLNKLVIINNEKVFSEKDLFYCDNIEMTKVKFNKKTGIKFPKLNEREWEKTKLEHNFATNDVPEHSFWRYRRIV